MRRQARISAGGALLTRTASALQVWLWLLIFVFQNEFRISRSIQPGYLDFDNLPETNFTCAGKVIGGYYADLETSCQMFHVCTVGQQDEPMDIKFLCLNGTVFDQETRVCERVDEVDCTKSEKFYSLNLELYGSTLAPIIEPDVLNTKTSTENTPKNNQRHETKDQSKESSTTYKPQSQKPEIIDSTEDPMQDIKKEEVHHHNVHPIHPIISEHEEPEEDNQEEEEIDSENPDYDDYTHTPTTTTQAPVTSTTRRSMPSSTSGQQTSSLQPSPTLSSLSPPVISSSLASSSQQPTVDPSLLSPQDFIYHHRGPGSEAISFQRQSFRPADGVYITHAPPQQFDHFEYESSRTAPRPAIGRPAPFVHRQPAPFKPTTLDPRDQLLRPGPSSQSSERHETIQHRPYLPPLPPQQQLPYDPYYFDRKRSDDISEENESFLSARSVAPPPSSTEKPKAKVKSPPRVIVTASASVSDSNGKRLNYSVGNVVSAVKPIVPINYDDYKESDLIFDPFFLDVPKLQKRRKSRASKNKITNLSNSLSHLSVTEVTSLPVISKRTTTRFQRISTSSTTTVAWNPNDYVDDNYEPHAYIPPEVPFVVTPNNYRKVEQNLKLGNVKNRGKFRFGDISMPTVASLSSSQSKSRSPAKVILQKKTSLEELLPSTLTPPAPSLVAPSCGNSRDCRNRA